MVDNTIHIQLSSDPLDINDCMQFIQHSKSGAQCLFTGTVRDHSNNKSVRYLQYSAYQPMAIKQMEGIAEKAKAGWPVSKIAIAHRIGHLNIGEIAVIVGVSSAHRKEAFEACQWIMDTIKQRVPIWKKEFYENGEEWVGAIGGG